MLLAGLTGGLASGKSTVARVLGSKGAVVVDADELSHRALASGSPGLGAVVEAFGPDVAPGGELDREALAGIVFADEAARRRLESIVHPEVLRLLAETVEEHRGSDRVVVFDAPLVFETGIDRACDLVVVVAASEEELVRRARARGMTEHDARARIAAQMPAAEREARADIVIRNDGTLEDLEARALELWADLRTRAAATA